MIEWILSATILMAVLIGLRFLLKGKISQRLQYALWVLVLLRLLIPVQLGSTSISVANAVKHTAASPVRAEEVTNLPPVPENPVTYSPQEDLTPQGAPDPETPVRPEKTEKQKAPLSAKTILNLIWLLGAGICALWLLLANIHFSVKLHRSRQPLQIEDSSVRVYSTWAIDTPCLFGLFRPAIYLPPEVCADRAALRYAIAHELTHRRHGDHIWSALRGVCLAVHWYNPLVWVSAILSKQDAELCCDEATIRRLGENERAEYGRTLLRLTCEKRPALLLTATTMTGNGRTIKERILRIAKKPKMTLPVLIAVLIAALILVGCTFTGAAKKTDSKSKEPTSDAAERSTGKIMFGNEVYEYSIEETTACALWDEMMTDAIPVPADKEPKENFECSTDAERVRVLMMENGNERYSLLVEEDGSQHWTDSVVVRKEIVPITWEDNIEQGVDEALAESFGKQAQEYANAFVCKTELYSPDALERKTILRLGYDEYDLVEVPIINNKEHTVEQMYDRMEYLRNISDRIRTQNAMNGVERYDYRCRSTITSCTDHGQWAMAEIEISRSFYYNEDRSQLTSVTDVYDVILLKYKDDWYIVDMYSPESGGPVFPEAETREMTDRELDAFRDFCENGPEGNPYPLTVTSFFSCYYDSFDVNEFDCAAFLRDFVTETVVTGEERLAALEANAKKQGSDGYARPDGMRTIDSGTVYKLSVDYLNAVMREYLPFLPTVPESWKSVKADGLVYLEEYDAFYRIDTVAYGHPFDIERGEWKGEYAILYEKDTGDRLTLWYASGRYWIFSHQKG